MMQGEGLKTTRTMFQDLESGDLEIDLKFKKNIIFIRKEKEYRTDDELQKRKTLIKSVPSK
jgi:hypothetical protein